MKILIVFLLLNQVFFSIGQTPEDIISRADIITVPVYFEENENQISKFMISGQIDIIDLSSIKKITCEVVERTISNGDSIVKSLIIETIEPNRSTDYTISDSSYLIGENTFVFCMGPLNSLDRRRLKLILYAINNSVLYTSCYNLGSFSSN